MKIFRILLSAALIFILSACSAGGYNEETCKQLSEKANSGETLSENDYNQMVDQTLAITKELQTKANELKGEKYQEYMNSEETKKMAAYAFSFGIYLEMNKSKLPESTLKKIEETQKEMKKLKN